jgi:hypothetical protein
MKRGLAIFHGIHRQASIKCGKLAATNFGQSQQVSIGDLCGDEPPPPIQQVGRGFGLTLRCVRPRPSRPGDPVARLRTQDHG